MAWKDTVTMAIATVFFGEHAVITEFVFHPKKNEW